MFAIVIPMAHSEAPTTNVSRQRFSLGTVGICHLSKNPLEKSSAINMLSISAEVKSYMREQKIKIDKNIKIDILEKQKHAELIALNNDVYNFLPNPGYYGPDHVTVSADVGKEKLRLEYYVIVMRLIYEGDGGPNWKEMGCPYAERVWIIDHAQRTRMKSLK